MVITKALRAPQHKLPAAVPVWHGSNLLQDLPRAYCSAPLVLTRLPTDPCCLPTDLWLSSDLRGWFLIDLISVLVSFFDVFAVARGASDGDGVEKLRAFRVLRALRLSKLLRLVKASRILRRWESRVAINYGTLTLAKSLLGLMLISHWLACVWVLQARLVDDPMMTWLGSVEYCTANEGGGGPAYTCVANFRIYTGALYWAVMTITSVGYGDVVASKDNVLEMWTANVSMLVAALYFAKVLADFCSNATSLEPDVLAFRSDMDSLNCLMQTERFPIPMRHRLREYLHHHRVVRMAQSRQRIVERLSPMLQGEVAWQLHSKWLSHVSFLQDVQRQFLVELAVQLKGIAFAPGDMIPHGHLYIIHDGTVLYRGTLLEKSSWYGEDMILQSVHLRDKRAACAMTYVTLLHIDRDSLMALADRYPDTSKRIRRHAFLMALRRELLLRSRIQLAAQDITSASSNTQVGIEADASTKKLWGAARQSQRPTGNGVDMMLWNATQRQMMATVDPLLGPEALAAKQTAQLTRTAREISEQGEQITQLSARVGGLATTLHSIDAKLGGMGRAIEELQQQQQRPHPPHPHDLHANGNGTSGKVCSNSGCDCNDATTTTDETLTADAAMTCACAPASNAAAGHMRVGHRSTPPKRRLSDLTSNLGKQVNVGFASLAGAASGAASVSASAVGATTGAALGAVSGATSVMRIRSSQRGPGTNASQVSQSVSCGTLDKADLHKASPSAPARLADQSTPPHAATAAGDASPILSSLSASPSDQRMQSSRFFC